MAPPPSHPPSSPPPPIATTTATTSPQFAPCDRSKASVICTTNDKTVNVEVVHLAPLSKYKPRVRKKKEVSIKSESLPSFQAHDLENKFQIGDIVQLGKCKPISKKKTFIAIPVPKRIAPKQPNDVESQELGIALESDSSLQLLHICASNA